MKYKLIAGVVVVFGVGLISVITPYPKEVFAITIGILCIIGGLAHLLHD